MQKIRTGFIRQVALSSIISLVLVIVAHFAGITSVFAIDKDLSSEVQVDMLMKTAKKDLEAERWVAAVEVFEEAMKLGVNLPGEFHILYGKVLFKTGSYEYSLSSLANYITLEGRDGEYYEEAITLVVDAGTNKKRKCVGHRSYNTSRRKL